MTTRRSETVQQWVSALEGMGRKVQDHGGYWMAQCPAHDDSNPSMRIKDKGDGTASMECYAGCDFVDILKAVGFYGGKGDTPPSNGHVAPPQPRQEPPKPQPLPSGRNITAYHYHDADGKVLFVVIRRDYAGKPKTFSQWIPAPQGIIQWEGYPWSVKRDQWVSVGQPNALSTGCPTSCSQRAAWASLRARSAAMPCGMHGPISRYTCWAGGSTHGN